MYQVISIIALLITFGGLTLHSIFYPAGEKRQLNPLKKLVHLFTLIFIEQKLSPVGVLRKAVYLLALLCFFVLAITGFYPTLISGEHISGYMLMIHATFAPILAICLAILAVMWASRCRFVYSDWPWFRHIVNRVTLVKVTGEREKSRCGGAGSGEKITFWLIIFMALPLMLSIVLSMFPVFGTYWQGLFLEVHRYTALVFAMAGIVHVYLTIRTQMQQ